MPERTVEYGLPPALLGWRWRRRESVESYLARTDRSRFKQTVLPAIRSDYPLPCNIAERDQLDRDGALWGYSMFDVPEREAGESYLAQVGDCRLLFFETPGKGDFFPAIVTPDGTSLECREISYRPGHAAQSVTEGEVQHFKRATWILERAYHNHSHWLTAHLPKLLMLREHGELDTVLMPRRRTAVMDASMRMLGVDPERFQAFDRHRPIHVEHLTLVVTDRFDPRLMAAVRDAFLDENGANKAARRKIFISRAKSRGRRLANEADLWSRLAPRGFERVFMEELSFAEQVRMMQECRILLAPHGAGLTNMIFCRPGGHVIEMADPDFPNPNFYALASALGLGYWLLHEEASDEPNPLDRDLTVDIDAVDNVLERLE